MSKRSRKRKHTSGGISEESIRHELAPGLMAKLSEPEYGPLPRPSSAPERPMPTNPMPEAGTSLGDIRREALKAQTETAHTIANLEAWRAEIDMTIAYLKARR